ncbi:MAG: transcriptional repressor LexA [Acidiferrobacterales bacterium]|nr:transcriptional repressor LexA [Acidiferrobacterales bacterium]
MAYTKPGQTRNRIYRFVRERLLEGQPPTVREVQEAFAMRSVQSARNQLDILVREGLLIRQPGKARGFRLPGMHRPGSLVPVAGSVSAGHLNVAVEDIEGYIHVQSFSDENMLFALRVQGESMVGAGIMHRDIVLVRHQAEIHSGDIVVAMVDDEATVKEFWNMEGKIQLRARNENYPTLLLDPENVVILGKVIEVRRHLEAGQLTAGHVNA